MCAQCEETLSNLEKNFLEYHKQLGLLTRQIQKQQRASIPVYIDEFSYALNDTSLIVPAQTMNVVKITTALISISSNGFIVIGSRVIGLATGTYNWHGLCWILKPSDKRQVNQNAAGIISMELFGETLVDQGAY